MPNPSRSFYVSNRFSLGQEHSFAAPATIQVWGGGIRAAGIDESESGTCSSRCGGGKAVWCPQGPVRRSSPRSGTDGRCRIGGGVARKRGQRGLCRDQPRDGFRPLVLARLQGSVAAVGRARLQRTLTGAASVPSEMLSNPWQRESNTVGLVKCFMA